MFKTIKTNFHAQCRHCDHHFSVTSTGVFSQCAEPACRVEAFWHGMTKHFQKVTLVGFIRGIIWHFILAASILWGLVRLVMYVPYVVFSLLAVLLALVFDL